MTVNWKSKESGLVVVREFEMGGMEMGYAFVPQEHDSFTLESCSVRESIPARRNYRNDVCVESCQAEGFCPS